MWGKEWGTAFDSVGTALSRSITLGFSGGLDQAKPFWEKAWIDLASVPEKYLAGALGKLASSFLDSVTSSLTNAVLKPLGDSLGVTSFLKDSLGSVTSFAASAGSTVASWLGIAPAAGGAAAAGTAGVGAAGATGAASAAAGAPAASSLAGSGFLSSALPALGVAALPEIMAQIMGTPGPIEVIGGMFSGGNGHTQQSALASIKADMEYLARATQDVQQAMDNALIGAENFGAGMLVSMSPATQEMQRLADLAGLGNDGLMAMVDALDPLQAKWIEASTVLGLAEEELGRMGSVLHENNEFLFGGISQTEAYSGRVAQLAEALKLPEAATASLIKTSDGLLAQWKAGEIGAEQVGLALKEAFAKALAQVTAEGDVTTEHMRALAEAIRSIPAEWTSVVNVVYRQEGDAPVMHWGGRVMHTGGWISDLPRFHSGAQVTSLAHDEVPIIARRGEYVVRAESVSAASLPWLAALNQTGRVPEAAAAPAVNLHVEVHGNILGNEDNLEDLARIMERKLKDIQAARWVA